MCAVTPQETSWNEHRVYSVTEKIIFARKCVTITNWQFFEFKRALKAYITRKKTVLNLRLRIWYFRLIHYLIITIKLKVFFNISLLNKTAYYRKNFCGTYIQANLGRNKVHKKCQYFYVSVLGTLRIWIHLLHWWV